MNSKKNKIWVFKNSLLFKIPFVFISLLLLTAVILFAVLDTMGKKLLQEEMYEEVRLTGIGIINRLDEQISHAESLAISLAKLAEQLPLNSELHKQLLPNIINYNDSQDFIAGGGIWPEPYLFKDNIERHSFFWGRNKQGILTYYDDYNNPDGKGYHQEEWYVPAQYIQANEVFWSKSYVDPYSNQSMVTVTAPMYKDKLFYGVSTVDLKLSGLKSLLEDSIKTLEGYAFAVDRNGKFLSFPDETLVIEKQSSGIEDYIYLYTLAQYIPEFTKVADVIATLMMPVSNQSTQNLVKKITDASYQINIDEATVITRMITAEKNNLIVKPIQFIANNDYFLNQPVFISIIIMPETDWKIIIVTPLNKIARARNTLNSKLGFAMLIYFTILTVFILWYLNRILICPLRKISITKASENICLHPSNANEILQLADLFNQRSQDSQAKSEFLSNMSHEFRTPLNAIMGFSQILTKNHNASLTKKQLDFINHIYTAGEHLSTLISHILEFSKMEAGKIEAKMEKVCLNLSLEEAIINIQAAFKDSNVKIINQFPQETIYVYADKQFIYQVLLNLLSNAIKYNRPTGTITLKSTMTSQGRIKIFIIDTGYGINEQDMKKLFQPFERLSAKDTTIPGNGIGLSYCEKLMALMEGSIGVDTIVNEGSSFWIEIKKVQ